MGVPKFYRWLSERYPCINENVNQYNMPEFDNFYVDMNGVFHICSHPSDDVQFRIPEAKIFENISVYVEYLFKLVRPKQVFFLSVDGVAPRSKMNQQRSRRFKTAKEAIDKEAKARKMGQQLPDDPRFDSNCITPGTDFMHRLHLHMVDFIANKVQHSQEWRDVKVIYSGYDVPGEGEHKIMDYIRYCKSRNEFHGDVRHCLYGLDADLINLGLSSHEPYFSLLREEVTFGKNGNKRHCDPFKTNFQLLHLSILRDYIFHEFKELEDSLKFDFDLERIIDDWILINFVVGNDFLPHVPKFHINKSGIQILYDSYKAILPTLDGYLNDRGTLILPRYQKFLQKLSEYDLNMFNETSADLKYFNADLNAVTFGAGIDMSEDFDFEQEDEEEEETEESQESADSSSDDAEIDDEFTMHKNYYYRTKLNFENLAVDVPKIVFEYLKGVQWVLHYYFDGCLSWNWYYPFHYGPYVSDLAQVDVNTKFEFDQSSPFYPIVQLMAVIPQASKELLPKAFQKLTYVADSPLINYFPSDVKIDLNEKIHDYEAIILIPFMEEEVLMKTYHQFKHELSEEELARNQFGHHHVMQYNPEPECAMDEEHPNVAHEKLEHTKYVLPPELLLKWIRPDVDLKAIIDFPTLNGINFTIKLEVARIKVFEFASNNPNMLLIIENRSYDKEEVEEFARNHINKLVYINWPLLSEAKLLELHDKENKYFFKGKKLVKEKLSPNELVSAQMSSRNYCMTLRNKKGIVIDEVNFVAKVAPMESQRHIITGGKVQLHKVWSSRPIFVPLDLLVYNVNPSYRKVPLYRDLPSVFTRGKTFFLVNNPYYGSRAQVIQYCKNSNKVQVKINVTSEPDFSEMMDQYTNYLYDEYMPEYKLITQVSRKLNVIDHAIRRLLGSVLFAYQSNKGRSKKLNLGLKLKFKGDYCVPGYSYFKFIEQRDYRNGARKDDTQDRKLTIFYSKKLISIFEEYYNKFPFVFSVFDQNYKPGTVYELDDLFTKENIPYSEKIKKIQHVKDWLDMLDVAKAGHVRNDANYVDSCVVKAIEDTIMSHNGLMCEEEVIEEYLSPASFYIPEFVLKGSYLPDEQAKYFVFDRVVNIKPGIAVPYGAKGTVIGIYRPNDELKKDFDSSPLAESEEEQKELSEKEELLAAVIEVMFDEPFSGGLQTRTKQENIYKMQAAWLINISYGQSIESFRSANFKNSKLNEPIQVYQRFNGANNSYNGDRNSKKVLEWLDSNGPSDSNYRQNNKVHSNQGTPNKSTNNGRVRIKNRGGTDSKVAIANNDAEAHFTHSENSPFKILRKEEIGNAQTIHSPKSHAVAPSPSDLPITPKQVVNGPPSFMPPFAQSLSGISPLPNITPPTKWIKKNTPKNREEKVLSQANSNANASVNGNETSPPVNILSQLFKNATINATTNIRQVDRQPTRVFHSQNRKNVEVEQAPLIELNEMPDQSEPSPPSSNNVMPVAPPPPQMLPPFLNGPSMVPQPPLENHQSEFLPNEHVPQQQPHFITALPILPTPESIQHFQHYVQHFPQPQPQFYPQPHLYAPQPFAPVYGYAPPMPQMYGLPTFDPSQVPQPQVFQEQTHPGKHPQPTVSPQTKPVASFVPMSVTRNQLQRTQNKPQ